MKAPASTPTRPYHAVPIEDCGEPLVELPSQIQRLEPHPYRALGADYQGRSPFQLRSGAVRRLERAQLELQRLQPGWQLLIFDTYRPIAVQRFMVEYSYRQLLHARQLDPEELSEQQHQQLVDEVLALWAWPSSNPATPPPHSTGAAVDLSLVDGSGCEVEMGSPIDELSERSHPAHFEGSSDPDSQRYHCHRQLLHQVMAIAGFQRHPKEWWHFSYGDQMWAWLSRREGRSEAIAIYGRVE
ncbi:M15 family metallopeptidase [Synechococcus sp. PCC 7336]|uniref:M15 family metallopeptidase n=1 Tax=Synechococcus sp. PCC 7336 TaxID=195250 RepID=UPI0003685EF2|nr:M15 family metallopeptidase [Synechococcus sp. PCC 7336]